jgi:hypothetical protein
VLQALHPKARISTIFGIAGIQNSVYQNPEEDHAMGLLFGQSKKHHPIQVDGPMLVYRFWGL